jgi:hypothetical protein
MISTVKPVENIHCTDPRQCHIEPGKVILEFTFHEFHDLQVAARTGFKPLNAPYLPPSETRTFDVYTLMEHIQRVKI